MVIKGLTPYQTNDIKTKLNPSLIDNLSKVEKNDEVSYPPETNTNHSINIKNKNNNKKKKAFRVLDNATTKVYISKFPKTWDEDTLRRMLSTVGTVKNVAMIQSSDKLTAAFGEFENPSCVDEFIEKFDGKMLKNTVEPLTVRKAHKRIETVEKTEEPAEAKLGPPGANIFVYGIPLNVFEKRFAQLFAPYGTILSIKLSSTKDANVTVKHGFVSYSTPQEADAAIHALNNYNFNGNILKVSVRKKDQISYSL
eukprot:TRINITY_DN2170_c0_g1_i1.p1 TRINITY_DN2170_c0_g1~~TRINITY_DN2170_c0_g1_i1.p1  ORF type:complete len:253 (-),score=69.48 TRINITY_DN2170_c0_g1_i1:99-857(-)